MNKPKTINVKKSLVRNPEQPVPKTIRVIPSKASVSSKVIDYACSSRNSDNKVSGITTVPKTRFNLPEMHSTLKLSKKIHEIVKPRKTKSLSEADRVNKLAVGEKVSRKVNFPYGQPVFKDLIPLTDNEVKTQPPMVTRGPAHPKDKEPILSDFLDARKQKVYYHRPRNNTRLSEEKGTSIPTSNSLKLYKVLQINEECM